MVGAVSEATATDDTEDAPGGPAAGVRWNLDDLYTGPTDPALGADLDHALEASREFEARYRGRVAALDPDEMAAALDAYEALQEPLARAGAYASLLFAADTSAPAHGALLQRVQERGTEVRNRLVFFDLEWVAVDEAASERLLAAPALARRRHLLRSLRRYRPHLLSEPEERILEETANSGERAFARLFDEILGAARFEVELDGRTRSLGEEETLSLLYDPDRERRRAGARGLTAGLRQHARVLSFIFNTLVQAKSTEDRLRDYADPMDARNLANEIDGASVRALMEAAEGAFPWCSATTA